MPPDPLGTPLGGWLRHQGLLGAIPHSYTGLKASLLLPGTLGCGDWGGQTLKVLLFWSGPTGWVARSLFVPQVGRWGSSVPASLSGLLSCNDWAKVTTILIVKDWVTWVTFKQGPHGMMSPGGLWFDNPQSKILTGSCLSTSGFQSISDCGWESS